MTKTAPLQVGQQLWYVPRQKFTQAKYVEVSKVGRKWAELKGRRDRVNLETLWIDGGEYTSPGRCYLSREEWEAETQLLTEWRDLRRLFDRHWHAPAGVSIETIRAARVALFPGEEPTP